MAEVTVGDEVGAWTNGVGVGCWDVSPVIERVAAGVVVHCGGNVERTSGV